MQNEESDSTSSKDEFAKRFAAGERCHASLKDGECFDWRCPQLRDGEPEKSGRDCPLETWKYPYE